MIQFWESDKKEVTATITFRHDISGEVKKEQGKIVYHTKLLGASLYRKEHYDKHYKHSVTFGCIYVNAATSGRSSTSKIHNFVLVLLRILGLLLCLPTWRVQYYSLGYKVTLLKAFQVIILGSVLVFVDYTTDIMTGVEHIRNNDLFWGIITIAIPLFMGFLCFLSRWTETRTCMCTRHLMNLICWTFFCPYLIARYFFKTIFEPNSSAIKETSENTQEAKNIFNEKYQKALIFKQTEAFIEASSQLFLQFYILFTRGYVTYTQTISITISILTLSLASADNHFSSQSIAVVSSLFQKIKITPLFVIIIFVRVIGLSYFCAFSTMGNFDVPILISFIIMGNVAIILFLKNRTHLIPRDIFFSSITSFLTTSFQLAPKSQRITLGSLLLFYHYQSTYTSVLGIIGCLLLQFYRLPRPNSDLPINSSYILLPSENHFQATLIFLSLLQLAPTIITSALYFAQTAGRGITTKTCTGIIQGKAREIQDANIEKIYISEVVSGTEGSKNLPLMVPGSSSEIMSIGTSGKVAAFALMGDKFNNELTLCRGDKFVVLPWNEDKYHNKNVWMKVRIISLWYDLNTRSMRHNIDTQPAEGSEGYIPSHLSFYEVIQMIPLEKWWWQPALELTGIWQKIKINFKRINCSIKKDRLTQLDYLLGGGECSKIFIGPVPQISFVCKEENCVDKVTSTEHSCQGDCLKSCSDFWLCGWCAVSCHANHSTEAVLEKITWDNSRVMNYLGRPWTGRIFRCSCSCQMGQEEDTHLLIEENT